MAYILLVDDNEDLIDNLRLILEMEGYQVRAAPSAIDAVEVLKQNLPVMILADIVMAGENGYDLCKYVKGNKRYDGIPFIFISALTTPHEVDLGLELGADDYVTKPFAIDEFLSVIHRYLG